jgi:hypothetical protein
MNWSSDEDTLLRELYPTTSVTGLLPKFPDRTRDSLKHRARVLGIQGLSRSARRRKFSFKEGAFSEVTAEAAYWAGFIAADGCVSRASTTSGGHRKATTLVVVLHREDEDHLTKLNSFLGNERPVSRHISNGRPQSRIQVYGCDGLLDDLERHYNITPAKSLTLKPPNLKEHALPFLIGLFDGDGSAITYNHANGRVEHCVQWVGTQLICEWVKSHIDELVPPTRKPTKIYNTDGSRPDKSKLFRVGGERGHQILRCLSEFDLPHMGRKLGRFKQYFDREV